MLGSSFTTLAAQSGTPDRAAADSAEAVRGALRWLDLLDRGLVTESLDSAAPLLREMVGSVDRWKEILAASRGRIVAGTQRTLYSVELAPELPGAPPGRYIRVAFRTAIGDGLATETVVMLLTDRGWRAAMYLMRGGSAP
jgi:hypothetical protein